MLLDRLVRISKVILIFFHFSQNIPSEVPKWAEECTSYIGTIMQISSFEDLNPLEDFCKKYVEFSKFKDMSSRVKPVFMAKSSEDGKRVMVKVVKLAKIMQCIAQDDIYVWSAMRVPIMSGHGCGLDYYYYPAEYFSLRILDGFDNRTPKLYDYFKMRKYKIDVIVMELFLPPESILYSTIQKGVLPVEEGRNILKHLIVLLNDMVDKLGLLHIDLHLNNIFYDRDMGVRLIDFDRIATMVKHETHTYLKTLITTYGDKDMYTKSFATTTPEFYSFSIPEYTERILVDKLLYSPTRYASYQVGAILYHTIAMNKPLNWSVLLLFYESYDPLPYENDTIPEDAKDFILKTTAIDYYKRIPLHKLLEHSFFQN